MLTKALHLENLNDKTLRLEMLTKKKLREKFALNVLENNKQSMILQENYHIAQRNLLTIW